MKNPLFSIIIPAYNVEKYLSECFDSVLNQNYDNYEVIIVDDGSTDSSSQICDDYSSKYEKFRVIHKKNEGLVCARQDGVTIAKGEYIICLDGDDWLHQNILEIFNDIITKHNPDIICTSYYISDGIINKNCYFPIESGFYNRKDIENKIFPWLIEANDASYFPPSVWAKCFKKTIYYKQQTAVDKNIKIGEDMACTRPCIYNSNSLFIVKEPYYYYRYNPSSMTKEKKAFNWDGPEMIALHQKKQIDLNSFNFQEQQYRFIVHNFFIVAVSQFNRKEPYRIIKKDIINHLSRAYIKEAILHAEFSSLKGILALFSLKYKQIWLLKLYNYLGKL